MAEGRGHYVLTARTTVDLGMQQAAQEALVNTLRHTGSRRNAATPALWCPMEPDGAVRAMVGGIDYEDNQFNRAAHARRQPGSSFKLYVYATAFENGYQPALHRARLRRQLRELVAAATTAAAAAPAARWPRSTPSSMSLNVPAVKVSLQSRSREGAGDDPAPRRRSA